MADVKTTSMLFRLPAEIREEIYRLATPLSPHAWSLTISHHRSPPAEPALLYVNRQIRTEALPIYYKHNRFVFEIYNLDARNYVTWCQAAPPRRLTANAVFLFTYESALATWERFHIRDTVSTGKIFFPQERQLWPNLLFWLKHYYHRRCLGVPLIDQGHSSAYTNSAAAMFEMVGQLGKAHDMSWEQVAGVLQSTHKAIGSNDSAWFGWIGTWEEQTGRDL